ncbi:hypothetical protein GGI35DRAFT_379018 [Trichoderma velutinum]
MTRMRLLKPRQKTRSLEPAANPAPVQCLARSEGAAIMMMKSLFVFTHLYRSFWGSGFLASSIGVVSHGILGISSYRPLFPFLFSLFSLLFPLPFCISVEAGSFATLHFMCFEKHTRALRQAR